MIRLGDRVRLNERAASALDRSGHNAYGFSWLTRQGIVVKRSGRAQIGIKWDDRRSLDWFAEDALVVLPEPPASTPETAGVSGCYGAGKAVSSIDPIAPVRTKRPPPIRMKRLRRGARDVV